MTKRWLSLVLVFTLLSTLFAGVAMADEVSLTFTPASAETTPITLEPGKENSVRLGTISCGNEPTRGYIQNGLQGKIHFDDGKGGIWPNVAGVEVKNLNTTEQTAEVWVTFTPLYTAPNTIRKIATASFGDVTFGGTSGTTYKITFNNTDPMGYFKVVDSYAILEGGNEVAAKEMNPNQVATLVLGYENNGTFSPVGSSETVTWSGSDDYVKVGADGTVTALKLHDTQKASTTLTASIGTGMAATVVITITDKVVAPVIDVAAPAADGSVTVTLSAANGASINYTMGKDAVPADPSETSGTRYTQAIKLTEEGSYYINAIAFKAGLKASDVVKSAAIPVKIPATGVTVSPAIHTIAGLSLIHI